MFQSAAVSRKFNHITTKQGLMEVTSCIFAIDRSVTIGSADQRKVSSEGAQSSVAVPSGRVASSAERVDVAWDRPAHWKASATMRSRNKISAPLAVSKSSSAATSKRPKTTVDMLPVMAATHSGTSGLNSLSFAPSWITASSSLRSVDTRNGGMRPGPRRIDGSATMEAEDLILEDAAVQSPTSSRRPSTSAEVMDGGVSYSQPVFSPGPSGFIAPLPGSGGRGRMSSTKARPGSLKARLQKLTRDCDAAENCIISMPSGSSLHVGDALRTTDMLLDARGRADSLADVEVVALLPHSEAGANGLFRVAKVLILHVWRNPLASIVTAAVHPAADTSLDSPAPVDGSAREDSPGAADSDVTAVVSEHHVESDESPLVGTEAVAYFKTSTCVGSGRSLRERTTLRIYNPVFVCASSPCRILCTQSWEPVDGVAQ